MELSFTQKKSIRKSFGRLKEAKDLVEGAPKEIKAGVPKKEADEFKKKLNLQYS